MSNRKTLKRKEGSEMAGYNVSPGNFWDIGNYSRAVKRIAESCAFNDELVKMYSERADIEAKYSKKLTEWNVRWSKHLEESHMYATMKTAALGTLKEAEDRAKIHMDCWSKIHDQVVESIKRHKESHYHKAFVGIKEAKDYEAEFAKAQKPWAAAFEKVQRAKKNYHSACKAQESASQALNTAKDDSETPMEKIKKHEDSLRKAEKNVENMKKKYEEKLSRIDPLNGSYEEEMRQIYDRWAKDEERRKDFIQRTLVDFHKSVNICSDNRLKECFDNQLNVAYSSKSQYDVKWWSENYGADMARNWPKFEVYSSAGWAKWSSLSLSSNDTKKFRRYTTRPRPHCYSSSPRAYSISENRKLRRRHTFSGKICQASLQYQTDTLPVRAKCLDHKLEKISDGNVNAEADCCCCKSHTLVKLHCQGSNTQPLYERIDCVKLKSKELGDVPEMPPPISTVEPPPSHSYQTQSSYQQPNNPQPDPYQQNHHQPMQQVNESYAPNNTAYVADSDPVSNPFMNGDGKDGFDDDEDDWDEPPPLPGGGVPVRALYDYSKVEDDELCFNAGDILTKLTEEDEQGWCRGRLNGVEGLYPANYVEQI